MDRAGVSGKSWTEQGYQVSHGQRRGIRLVMDRDSSHGQSRCTLSG